MLSHHTVPASSYLPSDHRFLSSLLAIISNKKVHMGRGGGLEHPGDALRVRRKLQVLCVITDGHKRTENVEGGGSSG